MSLIFKDYKVESQKQVVCNGKKYRVDYFIDTGKHQLYFEFDGPTHFCKTKTQMRDVALKQYLATIPNAKLIRIPFFIQITDASLHWLFGNELSALYDVEGKAETTYEHGFIDSGCVLPGDFNTYGKELFLLICRSTIEDHSSIAKSIYENATAKYNFGEFCGISDYDLDLFDGFWRHYPT